MFQLEWTQSEKLATWKEEQDAKILAKQREQNPEQELPYYGANGGAYTFSFTPTTLGMCVEVRNNLTKETINLTDFGNW